MRGAGGHGGARLRDADGGLRLEVAHGQPHGRDRLVRALQAAARRTMNEGVPLVRSRERRSRRAAPRGERDRGTRAVAARRVRPRGRRDRGVPRPSRRHRRARSVRRRRNVHGDAGARRRTRRRSRSSFDELREAKRRERELVERLRRVERWAEAGRAVARAAEEARHPPAALRAFARPRRARARGRASRARVPESSRATWIGSSGCPSEHRAYVTPGAGDAGDDGAQRGRARSVLQRSGERLVRRRVRLLKKLASDVPAAAPRSRARRAGARQSAAFRARGGRGRRRVRLETRKLSDHVLVELGHDGPFHAGDAIEQLFVPSRERPHRRSAGRARGRPARRARAGRRDPRAVGRGVEHDCVVHPADPRQPGIAVACVAIVGGRRRSPGAGRRSVIPLACSG